MIRPVVYSRTPIPGTILRERRQRLATHSIGTPFVRVSEDVPVRFSTTANIDTSSNLRATGSNSSASASADGVMRAIAVNKIK